MFGSRKRWLGRRARQAAVAAALAVLLGACVGPYPYAGPNAQVGALTGAAAGGLIGSAASDGAGDAIAAGVLLGGLLGGAVGDSLDRADRRYAAYSFRQGLEHHPSGHGAYWQNPTSGHAGSLTPLETYETAYGPCREFTQTVKIGRRLRRAYGTACRDAYGDWRIEP
jgi:surface antigen